MPILEGRVRCYMPDPEDYDLTCDDEPFDEYGFWYEPNGCRHLHCLYADDARRTMPPTETRDEREARLSDTELMRDEFHGRNE